MNKELLGTTWQEEVKAESFVNEELLESLLVETQNPTEEEFRAVMERAKKQERLTLREVSILLNTEDEEKIQEIFHLAKSIKERVYGNRVVLFAPLYLGNKCTNLCTYCGFKATNQDTIRKTLSLEEERKEIEALIDEGHKRLILVYGTHPDYKADYIAETVKLAYSIKNGNGEIRRVNINAAPQTIEDYKLIKEAGIGTYQIFQETYHEETYKKVHIAGEKSNFKWRLFGLSRAMEAGLDDVGIGALFGLYNWKFEVLGLMQHVEHLEREYNVGPHTISFPRLKEANGLLKNEKYLVNDDELKRIIAILRLAVPYTGLILTAREEPELRRECMELGVSQIDAGTQIELQGYSKHKRDQDLKREQFKIGDSRSLDEVMRELMQGGFTPSFCTACYRLGRTGEHFMEFSKPGFIHNFCTPNAVLTLAEYLEDYASEETKKVGYELIEKEIDKSNVKADIKATLKEKLGKIKTGQRDLYY
ncbi:MAG: 2-iminoacetate synthase [Fusobacteriaceae bacterium]|nr:biotin and thiamine synthesis associated [Fusobacteriales bacterium]MDN5303281.1 2-iminoacetate synthase [Fusobacteriaceae bacterium]